MLYTASQVTLYFGEKAFNYTHETVNEDYLKAYDILYRQKLEADYAGGTDYQREYDWQLRMEMRRMQALRVIGKYVWTLIRKM